MDYTFQINSWVAQGILFDRYIYVPEIHPITVKEFHEREDEGHIFKVQCALNSLLTYSITEDWSQYTTRWAKSTAA